MSNYKTVEAMIEAAQEAILDSSPESSIYIGCDSLRRKKNDIFYATYSTVVIIHMDSKHGAMIFAFTETVKDYGSMKQRLLNEVNYAVQVGLQLVDYIGKRYFELHLDLNESPRHKSNVALKEAIGYVQGTFGFAPKIKPFAFAASACADHIVRR